MKSDSFIKILLLTLIGMLTLGIGVINSRADDRVKIGRTEVSIGARTRIAEILTHAEVFQEKSAALLGGKLLGQYHTKLIVPRVQEG